MKARTKKYLRFVSDNAINLVLISLLTGVFAGVAVTFYNILAHIGEETSVDLYMLLRNNPAFIPLLFLGLAAGAIVIGTVVRFVPMIRGSGIPQIEGAARGIVKFKWYITICSMFAASLACIFMGLSAGAEGPSLEIGGCVGDGVGATLKRSQMVRRMQIASGSGAGFAVAFNAPITGVVFAMEEAVRSFSPRIFLCAALSIVSALITRNAIRPALGFDVGYSFNSFIFPHNADMTICLWVIPAAVVTSLVGVAFYYAVVGAKKIFGKITFLKGAGKFLIPFMLAGAFGLVTVYAMGGGSSFIQALGTFGTGENSVAGIFGISVLASIVIVVVLKFAASVMAMACGVPCGVFIPMLTIGAGTGAAATILLASLGMDVAFTDYIIMISMSVFFVTVVRAPITAIVLTFELTGQFSNFLPALLGIVIGYLIGLLFRVQPIYEKSLDEFIKQQNLYKNCEKRVAEVVVQPNSSADGENLRTVIWPTNGLIVKIVLTDGNVIVPDGETVMHAGDTLVFECETDDEPALYKYLYEIVGKPEE